MSQLNHDLKQHLGHALGLDVSELADDTELFSSGLVDSLSVLDLVSFVERQSGTRIAPSAITLENFDSVARIARFVSGLQTGQAHGQHP